MAAQGWCPSTHRIHEAADGGLARVRVPGGVLTTAQLRAVAAAAVRFGNGVVELTNRANLQLRGVAPASAASLRTLLAPVGLSHPSAEVEDRRNVLASPTAGLADDEVVDVRPLVAAAVAALDALPVGIALPHKVGVLLDGGGTPTLRDLPMDVALGAQRAGSGAGPSLPPRDLASRDRFDGVAVEVALGAALADGPSLSVRPADVGRVVDAALRLCASPPDGGPPRRMADVVADCGRERVVAALAAAVPRRPLARPAALPDDVSSDDRPSEGAPAWVAVVPPTSPAHGDDLERLAAAVEAAGGAEVRLTPWRSVVVPLVGRRADLVDGLAAAGWRVAPVGATQVVGASA